MKKIKLPAEYSKLTWQERIQVREQYIKEQEGKCFFCGNPLDKPAPKEVTSKKINWDLFPENFLKYPVHLQHDHDNDMTEGAVHNYCNAVAWQYLRR